jgi:hypothetical protein
VRSVAGKGERPASSRGVNLRERLRQSERGEDVPLLAMLVVFGAIAIAVAVAIAIGLAVYYLA